MNLTSCRNHGKNTETEILSQDAQDGNYSKSKHGKLVLNSSKLVYLACMIDMQKETEISGLEVHQIPNY